MRKKAIDEKVKQITLIHDIYDNEKVRTGEIYGKERLLTSQNHLNKKSP